MDQSQSRGQGHQGFDPDGIQDLLQIRLCSVEQRWRQAGLLRYSRQ